MNLKELKSMVAQQAVRSIIESKVSEASTAKTTPVGRTTERPIPNTDTFKDTFQDTPPSEAIVYHAKKKLKNDSVDPNLPDNLRKAAAYLSARQSYEPNSQLDAETVDNNDVMEYLIGYIVDPYAGSPQIKPYLGYLESEQQEASHEKDDKNDSLQALGGDNLELVNVDPSTGYATKVSSPSISQSTKTAPMRKAIKESTVKNLEDAIRNIKYLLKN